MLKVVYLIESCVIVLPLLDGSNKRVIIFSNVADVEFFFSDDVTVELVDSVDTILYIYDVSVQCVVDV